MTRDLEAALREARDAVTIWLDSGYRLHDAQKLLARIDAALSAASDEASAKNKARIDIEAMLERNRRMEAASLRPAPSEAPNVERARDLWWSLSGRLDKDKPKLDAALDSARAEGIAAERERAAKIADEAEPALFHRVAAAIRAGAKP